MERHYDFIVVGSGIAGLFYALQIVSRNNKAKIAIFREKSVTKTECLHFVLSKVEHEPGSY